MSGLSIIVPSKTASNLLPCVAAVRKHEPCANVIVVDDGIDWSEYQRLGSQMDMGPLCPGTGTQPGLVVEGVKPFIFARNVNIGIRAAGADDVVLLNDDAVLESPGGFTLLAEACENDPQIGVIASSCNNVGNTNQWRKPSGGVRFDPRMVCFIAVYIPRRTIETVGFLDEEFVGYGFDDDSYCVRVRRTGLKIAIHDGCFVDHSKLRSTFRGPGGPGGSMEQNAEIFRRKYGASNREV